MANNDKVWQITDANGVTYDITDNNAQTRIADLEGKITGAMHYLGITTTALTDGSTTATIAIGGTTKTMTAADAGAIVIYGELEFIWNGTKWQLLGGDSPDRFGALAYKDSASGEYTPAGTLSAPKFTGTQATITSGFTPAGSVSVNAITPSGSVSKPTVTVTPNTATVNSITAVGTLPSCTLPSLSTTYANGNLTFGWSAGSFSAGTLPTKGSNQTVVTGIKSVESTTPTFTGDEVTPTASFTGTAGEATATYTPAGTNAKPTFTGTKATITVS